MVTDEMVRRAAEVLHYHSGGDPAAPPSESDIQFWRSYAEAALSAVAPLIAAQAHREAYDVAHAFARGGVTAILARLVDLMDGEIGPSDAAAQARREALEEAARLCDAESDAAYYEDRAASGLLDGIATAIRALANKPKETTP